VQEPEQSKRERERERERMREKDRERDIQKGRDRRREIERERERERKRERKRKRERCTSHVLQIRLKQGLEVTIYSQTKKVNELRAFQQCDLSFFLVGAIRNLIESV
jgi:hypothetical protein